MLNAVAVALLLTGCQAYESAECVDFALPGAEPLWGPACDEPPTGELCGEVWIACVDNPTFCAPGPGRVTGDIGGLAICPDGAGPAACPNGNTPRCVFVPHGESRIRRATGEIPEECGGLVLEPCE